MCGITACVGCESAADVLLSCLENLEYRGYDSAGIAVPRDGDVAVCKREGSVERLVEAVETRRPSGGAGIGHTRWSTHGEPSDRNAHPHTDCDDAIAVVHNGIVENHRALRKELAANGHRFRSGTDTEVVPHLVEEFVADGATPHDALRRTIDRLEGSYAVAMVVAGDPVVYAARDGSPLVLGVGDGANFLASDVPAFLDRTDDVVYVDDGDVVELRDDDYLLTGPEGEPRHRSVETVDWTTDDAEKGRFEHYMFKEIHEQPRAVRQALQGRVSDGCGVSLDAFPPGSLADVDRVQFVACGTSYHAALYGTALLADREVPADAFLASEYVANPPPSTEDTLVVGVTQSGETADTLEALRAARSRNLRTTAVTNVVGSTAARECDDAVLIRAGPEIGVAATKTFSSQIATLSVLVERIADDHPGGRPAGDAFVRALHSLPESVQHVIERSEARDVARRYRHSDAYFFIGRSTAHPVALEGALKLKEISYEHAEGFAAGELKHGPLALVTSQTPVFAVEDGRHEDKLVSNVEEIQARNAPVVAVAPPDGDVAAVADHTLAVPAELSSLTALVGNVQLQLLSYHVASFLDRPIDKPRNLAKSVTVE